jgi:hypothetical protein
MRRRLMAEYVKMSTANPTGWRPWNSRLQGMNCAPVMQPAGLGYYIVNSYPLPTTGRGPFLLQPGANGVPAVSGGMGDDSQILGVSFDPTLMIAGLGLLMVAMFLTGRKHPARRKRKKRPGRMRRAASAAYQQLAAGS